MYGETVLHEACYLVITPRMYEAAGLVHLPHCGSSGYGFLLWLFLLWQVLEQVVNCKDTIAQQYLMECVIQVFPLEYHVATLKPYLEHAGYLSVGADVKALLICLMERLSQWTPPEDEPEEDNVFALLSAQVSATIQKEEGGMELLHVLQLHKALLNFALGVYPAKLEYADQLSP